MDWVSKGFVLSLVYDHLPYCDRKFRLRSCDDSWASSTEWKKTVRSVQSFESLLFDLCGSPYVVPKGWAFPHYRAPWSLCCHASQWWWWCRQVNLVVEWEKIEGKSTCEQKTFVVLLFLTNGKWNSVECRQYRCIEILQWSWTDRINPHWFFLFMKRSSKHPQWSPALNNQPQQWVISCWYMWQRSGEDCRWRWRGNWAWHKMICPPRFAKSGSKLILKDRWVDLQCSGVLFKAPAAP